MFNTRFRPIFLILVCWGLGSALGCGQAPQDAAQSEHDGEREPARAPRDAVPDLVPVPATKALTAGFAGGVLREQLELDAFRITRHPVTRAQYRQCVKAGACAKSDGSSCALVAFERLQGRATDAPEGPQLCTTVKEAASYCAWIGGRLPELPQWLHAARGPSPQRYAWGEGEPSCERHPHAADVAGAFPTREAAEEQGCVPAAEARLAIAEHAAGAAPSGMQDVLLTPAELLAPQAKAQFSACSSGFAGCLVYGHEPGAIDAVYPIDKHAKRAPAEQSAPLVYGFRCVLEEN